MVESGTPMLAAVAHERRLDATVATMRLPSALLTLLVVALVGAATASAALPPSVTIGAVFSQTGSAAVYAKSQTQGAQLAIDAANTARALPGTTLTLTVRDDASTGEGAAAAFTSLIDGGATALLGPTLSNSALVADKVAQARGVPVMGISNTIDGITDIGNFVFRNSLPESAVQPQTVRVAKKRFGLKRVAIVWATPDAYSAGSNAVFHKALKAQHVRVTSDKSFATGDDAALRAALRAAARTRPDALVISALQGDVVKAMISARTFHALKKVPFIGGNAFNAPGLVAATGGAADGAVSGTAWLASRGTPGNAAFIAKYKAAYGTAPDQFAAQAWTGVWLYVEALRRAGTADHDAVRSSLAQIQSFPTVLGAFSFDTVRNPVYKPVVVILRNGKQVPITG